MSEIAEWFLENTDVWLHPSIRIGNSTLDDPVSGYGVFFNFCQARDPNDDRSTIELMRIPRKVTFDVHTVFQILNDEKWYSSKQACERTNQKFKEVFANMLEQEGMLEVLSESNTLVGFFIVCILLKDKYELPTVLAYYLNNVLLKTIIGTSANYAELIMEYYSGYMESHQLQETLGKFERFASEIPRETIRQLFAAVKSRCLEIPQELYQDSDDFVVNSTLVPVLDLCNHRNHPNAYFDVDRKTGDVILRLDLDKCTLSQKDKWQEIFISYSPSVEIFSFHNTYGFIPTSDDFQFFNISLQRDFLSLQKVSNGDLRLFFKWFKINPVVQLIKFKGKWYINDASEEFALLLLPFLPSVEDFTKSCWYYDDRKHETLAHFYQCFNKEKNSVYFPQSSRFYKNELERQEKDECDVISFPQLAWSFHYKDHDKLLRRRLEQMDALELAPFDDPKQFELVIERFKDFFLRYLDYRESKLMEYLDKESANGSFGQLLHVEVGILQELRTGLKENQLRFWSDLDVDVPEMVPRPALLWNRSPQLTQSEWDTEKDSLREMDSYDPQAFTDFYDEELSNFLTLMQD